MQVLYLVFNEGYTATSISQPKRSDSPGNSRTWWTTQSSTGCSLSCCCTMRAGPAAFDRTERSCRSPSRTGAVGTTNLIAEGVTITQTALARDQLGAYQAQAAIAALHADAPHFKDTDWVQIVEWYNELLRFTDTPIVRLNRAVAVGEADGALSEHGPIGARLTVY